MKFSKRWFGALLLGAALFGDVPLSLAQGVGQSLDLRACYDLAVLKSENLGIKDQEIRAVAARYWQAMGRAFPEVRVILDESVENRKTYGSIYAFGVNRQDHFETRLNARQPLFNGFREFSAATGFRAEGQGREFSKRHAGQLLFVEVTQAFYDVLRLQKDRDVLLELVKVLEDREKELNRRVSLGRSRKSEVLQAKVELGQTKINLHDIALRWGGAREQLAFLTGLPPQDLSLIDTQALPSAEKIEHYLLRLDQRPDVQAAAADEKAAGKRLRVAQGAFAPSINAEGNWYVFEDPKSERDWDVKITLDLPLFEGGTTLAKVKEAKRQMVTQTLYLQELRRQTHRDLQIAYATFVTSLEKKVEIENTLAQAEENYRLQKSDFSLSRATNIDVLQALRQVYELKRQAIDVDAEIKTNHVRLQVTSGSLSPNESKDEIKGEVK